MLPQMLKSAFSKHTTAFILAGSLIATPLCYAQTPGDNGDTQENTTAELESCQLLSASLSVSDIDQRKTAIDLLQHEIEASKFAKQSTDALENSKNQLILTNILDRFRLNLLDYRDWDELTNKLKNNGVVIDKVCVRGYQYLNLPVVLHEEGNGTASLDINFYMLDSQPTSDGHQLVGVATRSLEEIAAMLEPELISRAIRFAALSGTSPDKAPLLNKSLSPENLVFILTLWEAQAAAEQILQAADTFARTGKDHSFSAVRADYPYLDDLIEDVQIKTAWLVANDETLDGEDRITFRQLAAQTMLNIPEIRVHAYESILAVIQDMAGKEIDLKTYFNHEMTDPEMSAAIARLDESFTRLPVENIYARWRDGPSDPAQEVIDEIVTLKNAPRLEP